MLVSIPCGRPRSCVVVDSLFSSRGLFREPEKAPSAFCGGSFDSDCGDVDFNFYGDILHQPDFGVKSSQSFDGIHLNFLFVDFEALFRERGGDLSGGDAAEHFPVFSDFEAYIHALTFEFFGEFFGGLNFLCAVELFRGLFLIDFIYTAGSGGFGESLFEEKIFSEAVGDFDNIAFFAAALRLLSKLPSYFCPPFAR